MEKRDQKRIKKKMSATPNSSPPNNGEVRDHHQNSLSSSSAQTLNNLQNPHPPPSTQPPGPSPYRECLKNHATATGGHVVDGCGEFMPAGEEGTPDSLKCAACDCHRNFHRREIPNSSALYYGGGFHHPPVSYYSNAAYTMPPPPLSLIPDHRQSRPGSENPVMVAFGGGGGAVSASSEEAEGSSGKKRFRTKFTAQQKDKMAEFAEKLEWKISKQDEKDLARFCAEMGINRQVFKVWMHNSKQALKKKNQDED